MNKIMVRYGELVLKGSNIVEFKRIVINQIKNKIRNISESISITHDLIYIDTNELSKVITELSFIPGIDSYSIVYLVEKNLDSIIEESIKLIERDFKDGESFKMETKRSDKSFPLTSPEITIKVSKEVMSKITKKISVDVHNPTHILNIDLRAEGCYLYCKKYPLLGGMPYGKEGTCISLLSGGIDSPVSSLLAIKRGLACDLFHFESTPLTPIESIDKVIELAKKLSRFTLSGKIRLHLCPFQELHKKILSDVNDPYKITIMRRMMYRIVTYYAKSREIECLVNGESLAQVASQTLQSIQVISEVTDLLVLRPLITYDKKEIVKISADYGFFDTSIKPFNDCCSIYVPRHPVIRPKSEICLVEEAKFDYMQYVTDCVNNVYTMVLDKNSDVVLADLGFDFSSVKDKLWKKK